MPPEKTGVSVRKTARYAGNIRGPLHEEYWNPRDAEDFAEHVLMVTRR
jgi:hypothetical protein